MARASPDEPIAPLNVSPRVTRERLADGRLVAVKRAAPGAPLEREASVLRFLASRGCAVPEVVSSSAEQLTTLWCGEATLDEALQRGLRVSGAALVDAVQGVSHALSEVAPAQSGALPALVDQLEPWVGALPGSLEWVCGATPGRLIEDVVGRVRACEPEPGSLDYNARNVLVDVGGERVWLIDFAATGFDWTERRLGQYALSVGAVYEAGIFRSALSAVTCAKLDDPSGVDAQEVLLLLIAAEQLRQVESGVAHAERRRAWRNVAERKASLVTLLQRPLADRGPAARLRAALR